jgi:nucleoside-diphosphate-sugar epimerase
VERILLIGANGQLGTDLRRTLPAAALIPLTRADLDITDPEAVDRALAIHSPAWVINTAAYHLVDDIERDPEATRQAFLVNAAAAHHLGRANRRPLTPPQCCRAVMNLLAFVCGCGHMVGVRALPGDWKNCARKNHPR